MIAILDYGIGNLKSIYKQLDLTDVEALVLSACVQMPSLPAVDYIENEIKIPVTTAAICTTYRMLKELGLKAHVPMGGALLSGNY